MDATQFAPPTFTKSFRGGDYAGAGVPASGIYSAVDLRTNRIVWQRRFNDGCRSGSLVTAGGLVFLGRNDGRVIALDASTGDRLWQFQTEAAVNSAVSTFMHNGQQMLVSYSGGGFVSAKKGDGVWLFGLKGTLEPIVPTSSDAVRAPATTSPKNERAADAANGERLYKTTCVYCHGDHGQGGEGGGKSISPALGVDGIIAVLNTGRDKMPAFGAALKPEELRDLATYVHEKLLVP